MATGCPEELVVFACELLDLDGQLIEECPEVGTREVLQISTLVMLVPNDFTVTEIAVRPTDLSLRGLSPPAA